MLLRRRRRRFLLIRGAGAVARRHYDPNDLDRVADSKKLIIFEPEPATAHGLAPGAGGGGGGESFLRVHWVGVPEALRARRVNRRSQRRGPSLSRPRLT
eukprot:COSAG01_NODE_1095_length_11714_cov_9.062930_2_plen_99_part_00